MGQQCSAPERELSNCPNAAMRMPPFEQTRSRTTANKQKPRDHAAHRMESQPQHAPNQAQAAYWQRDATGGTVYKKMPAPPTPQQLSIPVFVAGTHQRETNTASPNGHYDRTPHRVPSSPDAAYSPSPQQPGSSECARAPYQLDSPYYSPGPKSPDDKRRQARSPNAELDLGKPYISDMMPGVVSVVWPQGIRLRAAPQPAAISADQMIAPCGFEVSVTQFSIDRSGCEYGYAAELGSWLPTRLCTGESLVSRISDLPENLAETCLAST